MTPASISNFFTTSTPKFSNFPPLSCWCRGPPVCSPFPGPLIVNVPRTHSAHSAFLEMIGCSSWPSIKNSVASLLKVDHLNTGSAVWMWCKGGFLLHSLICMWTGSMKNLIHLSVFFFTDVYAVYTQHWRSRKLRFFCLQNTTEQLS